MMWMWRGAHGSTHGSGTRGPGFNPTPKPRMALSEALISLLSDNRLKNNFHSFVILWCQVEINNIKDAYNEECAVSYKSKKKLINELLFIGIIDSII